MGDILPYTCIAEDCLELENLYSDRTAWLGHMNGEHGGPDQWICFKCAQTNLHVTFEQLTDLIAHFEQHHNKGLQPSQVHGLLSGWRRKVPYEIPACPLCFLENTDQDALLDHTAAHLHSFSLKSLPWASSEDLKEDADGDGECFKFHPYFEAHSFQPEASSRSAGIPPPADIDSGNFVDSGLANDVCKQQQLTEDLLEQIPDGVPSQVGMREWAETLDSAGDTEIRESAEHSCATATRHDEDKAEN